jgi:hypothetical protein
MARLGYPKNMREFRWQFATEAVQKKPLTLENLLG